MKETAAGAGAGAGGGGGMMKERLKVEELEENREELKEVAEDVFPVIVFAAVLAGALLFLFLVRLYLRWGVACPSRNRLDDKTVIITGANCGLGRATATEMAKRGARVILGCRDRLKGEAVARIIRKKSGNQNVFAARLDLANLRTVREFAEEFHKEESKLHVLINNAGYLGPKAATDDGYERTLGVNYLGHFYLTLLLVEKLRKCAPSRIINVCSDAYTQGKLELDDLPLLKGYDPHKAYARSKLAQMVFNLECHRHFFTGCVWSFAVDPGACCTEIRRHFPGMHGNMMRVLARLLYKSPDEGCQTIVYCALADGLRDFSGKFFSNCKVVKVKDFARDQTLGRKLWNLSLTLTGLENQFLMYAEHEEEEGEDTSAEKNGTQVLSVKESGDGGKAEGTTGPEKRASAAAAAAAGSVPSSAAATAAAAPKS